MPVVQDPINKTGSEYACITYHEKPIYDMCIFSVCLIDTMLGYYYFCLHFLFIIRGDNSRLHTYPERTAQLQAKPANRLL